MGIRSRIKKIIGYSPSPQPVQSPAGKNLSSSEYWTQHNVTSHQSFSSREDSLAYLDWRNAQYLFYDQLMPCSGFDGKVVLDYGCGPGNDVVGFAEYSSPVKVIAMDVSSTSLAEAEKRMSLHRNREKVEYRLIKEKQPLPIESSSVDYIHSSGVLHHTPNIDEIMMEFNRILRPGGMMRIMVYNYNSLWVHLYVAYERQLLQKIDAELPLADAFRRSTDGPDCPISRFYTPESFSALSAKSGFTCEYKGAAISLHEMKLLPKRLDAIFDIRLAKEHRDFLRHLQFDTFARPMHQGHVAGIDAVFELRKKI